MTGLHKKADIIRYIESLPDEESARIAIFIAGMQAQKSIVEQDKERLPKQNPRKN